MREHINGIITILIFIVVVSLLTIYKHRLRKILDKQKFWVIFNTVWLVYFLSARYIPYIIQSATHPDGSFARQMLIQNIFMTNVCPMATTTIIIGSYFRRFRTNFGPSIAMVALFGGTLNMLAIIMSTNTENVLSFIFLKTTVDYPGESVNNYLWFMTHMMLVVQGILLLIMCRRVTLKHIGLLYVWSASFMTYVAILMGITGIRHDVGGLWINDWIQVGDYKGVFYRIGSKIWPTSTHGWKSFAKVISGVLLLYACGAVFMGLSWYFVNYENKHDTWKRILSNIKK